MPVPVLTDPIPECSLGWQVAHWIETLLCHGPGDVEGQPISLDEDLFAATVRAYALNPDSGRRLIRRYILSRPKGRAKSEFAGMLACVEALGPTRFDHWAVKGETSWWGYQYDRGDPVGRPVIRPFIRCLATEELQSGNTYDNVHFMLTDPRSAITGEVSGIDAGLTRTFLPQGGEIRPSSASSASKDGGKETFAVLDESHLYVLPELRAMAATVLRNMGKRVDGMVLETTTMFEQGANSTAEETFRAVEAGKLRRGDIIFDHHEGPDPDTFDYDDDAQLLDALREAYRTNHAGTPHTWVDLEAKLAVIRDPTTDKHDAVRYFLNRAYSMESDVVHLEDWTRLTRTEQVKPGETITVGFDGSDNDDSTGIVGCRGSDGLKFKIGLWEKPSGAGEWRVPRLEVRERVAWAFTTFRVVRFYGDDRYWETDFDEWQAAYGDKVVVALPQSDKRLWYASRRFVTLVANAVANLDSDEPPAFGDLTAHDGDPDLTRHLLNARRVRLGGRLGRDGGWRPAKKKHDRKIDLAVAAIFADEARGDAVAAGDLADRTVDPLTQIW